MAGTILLPGFCVGCINPSGTNTKRSSSYTSVCDRSSNKLSQSVPLHDSITDVDDCQVPTAEQTLWLDKSTNNK
jgi:hypothetical protein